MAYGCVMQKKGIKHKADRYFGNLGNRAAAALKKQMEASEGMLGGSLYIALIRFAISLAGTILLFSLMSESKFDKKKTALCYGGFGIVLIMAACVWYVVDWESCVKMVAFVMYICFAVFSICISRDPVFLSIYKLALTFYLLAVFLIAGIEIAVVFFDRNVWADIMTRILLILLMAGFIDKKIKEPIRQFGNYVENELDRFSAAVMTISILFGIGFILNPNVKDQTPYRLFQIAMNFFLTGALQLLVFRLYLHIGREKEYQKENQLMEMNQRLLERQMELLEESVESGRKIRHDVRHHTAVIAEYTRRGQNEELLEYLKEYEKETEESMAEAICANTAVNNILSAYTRKARKEQIKVTLDVDLGRNFPIPNIDLVTILANAYENAIYGCMEVKKQSGERECFIHLMLKKKKSKLVICCSNTCRMETELKNGRPKPEATGGIGVLSIIKTADKFEGEYDFKNDNGVFVFRLIMNIPAVPAL
ncbi:MAG: GHKL domain-containing protein [Roseburia sp.]|nr:GHKL domain-containing protein [Roseburia sp.]MCM1278712.1 GHKL domain-containing protein [Robinsoniella sp.]